MKLTDLLRVTPLILSLQACIPGDEGDGAGAGIVEEGSDEAALTRSCAGVGAPLRGMDVSYYQGRIDWDRVKAAGIEFAVIRVSDGTANFDSQFTRNWSEARRVGIRRSAYQFFRPNVDVNAQADLLLTKMGPLQPGDLPPVIDVEASGGLGAASVATKVRQWIDRIRAATGATPIIYTGPYFWRDSVGSPSYSVDYPLWVAHYTTSCPLVPEPWTKWTFHQYSDSGRVDGVSGNVDVNLFNGTAADLDALAVGGVVVPPRPACGSLGQNGGLIEETDSCVTLGGPAEYLRTVSGGHGGSYVWTGATSSSGTTNSATYTFRFDAAGDYKLEAYAAGGTSKQTKYEIATAGGTRSVVIDQSRSTGFNDLGTYTFAAATNYTVRIVDNTGEASSLGREIVFDAMRATPAAVTPPNMPPDPNACQPIAAAGRALEEDDACVELGGPAQYLRSESGGSGGSHVWTGSTNSNQPTNYARWALGFEQAGLYRVEAYVGGASPNSRESKYRVTHAGGADEIYVDQSTASGFVELGAFNFAAGGGYEVRIDDNTGESSSLNRRVIIDAVRLSPISALSCRTVTLASGVSALNVRPRPNTAHNAVAQLSAGRLVDRLATVSGELVSGDSAWYRIRWGTTVGYISAHFATCVP